MLVGTKDRREVGSENSKVEGGGELGERGSGGIGRGKEW